MNKFITIAALSLVANLLSQGAFAAEIKGDAKAGATKNAMCIGCHGIQGYQASFPEVYKVPMIAGQGAPYIVSALKAYQEGARKHPTMRAIAVSLTDQDMADLAAYYAQQGKIAGAPELPATPTKAPSERVAALIAKSACASCHGINFSKPHDPSEPKLAGQHKDYLYVALKAYKTEGNPSVGRSNGVMGGIAKQLSLADMKELTRYIGSLDGELKTVPQSKMHRANQ
ncbi:MAG: c-type cytochrome [Cytophagales bacterium]|nr:c-type cytochrome [Cytophagales bacterium]